MRLAALVPVVASVALAGPVRMTPTPGYVLRVCRTSALIAPVCPRKLPYIDHLPSEHAYDLVGLCRPGRSGCAGVQWDDLEIEASGGGGAPPVFTHIAIFAGNLSHAFPFAYPTHGSALRLRDGLVARPRSRALFFGRFAWGGERGTLVLAPGYPGGGEQGDHLIFRWRRGPVEYAVGLHAWEPLTRTAATLHAIVESTG